MKNQTQHLDQYSSDYLVLLEAGFIAINQADGVAAEELFAAAKLLEPDNNMSDIGMGYVALNKLQMPVATQIFSEVLKSDPENPIAQGLLSLTYALQPKHQNQGKKMAQKLQKSLDPLALQLSNAILNLVEHFEAQQQTVDTLAQEGIKKRAASSKQKKTGTKTASKAAGSKTAKQKKRTE